MVSPFPMTFWSRKIAATVATNPQLQFFENFPGKNGNLSNAAISSNTLSIHAVNIPLSLSFNQVALLLNLGAAVGGRSLSARFGLYSLNGSTLSLANSASNSSNFSTTNVAVMQWWTLATSATQNISPGNWYFALNLDNGTVYNVIKYYGNASSALALQNAAPTMLHGRMTASTDAMPASIATSDLDITGADAIRQPYIIITA